MLLPAILSHQLVTLRGGGSVKRFFANWCISRWHVVESPLSSKAYRISKREDDENEW